jgi:hypothetical protein
VFKRNTAQPGLCLAVPYLRSKTRPPWTVANIYARPLEDWMEGVQVIETA